MKIIIKRGDSRTLNHNITDRDNKAFDISSYEVKFKMQANSTGAAAEPVELSSEVSGEIEKTQTTGEALIYLKPSHTATNGIYKAEVQITKDDDVYTTWSGLIEIVEDIIINE